MECLDHLRQLTTDENFKTYAYGLAFACPYGECLDTCPLKKVREDNPEYGDRIDVINKMGMERIKMIVGHHFECSYRREQDLRE